MSEKLLFLVSRTDVYDYDDYDSFIVCCSDEDEARKTHPGRPGVTYNDDLKCWTDDIGKKYGTGGRYDRFSWIRGDNIDTLTVKYLGTADKNVERGIVLASFNAG